MDTSDYCAFGTFALGACSGGISTKERVIDVTHCLTDNLPLHLQTQPVRDLPDLVDVREHLVTANEVPADDLDGDWREATAGLAGARAQSKRSAARAAPGGRGSRRKSGPEFE